MDKLQPLIRHHFWICFVLALIFAMTGWWKANAKISEEIEARSKSVADSFSNATKGADAPNKTWSDGAQAINASDRKKYESASKLLWERQKAVRVFDPEIREKMAGIKYMDPIPKVATRGEWGILYEKMFQNVLDVVNPFKPAEGTGLVIFDEKRVTHMPFNTWRLRPPTSDEIWKLQEDMWLLRSLLTSLSRVNDGSRRLTESGLREIVQLKLRGGQRDAPLPPIAAGGAGFSGFGGGGGGNAPRGGDDDGNDGSMAAFGGGNAGGVMPGGVAGQRSGPWTQYELPATADFMTEEFGPVGGPLAMGGGGGGGRGNAPDDEDGGSGFSSVAPSAFGAGGGTGMEPDRYVDEDPALPYKTRAFFLHVRIRESEIPRMLAELTDSSFPVEIVRLDVTTGTSSTAAGAMFTGGNAGGLRGNSEDEDGGGFMGGGMAGINMMAAGGGGNAPQLGNNPGLPANSRNPLANSQAAQAKAAKAAQAAQQTLAAAMMDPSLVTVRVGGLMTLYQTKDEADAQTSNEAAAQQEGGPAAAPQQPAPESGVTPSDSDAAKTPDGAPADEAAGTGAAEKVTTEGENAVPEQNPQDPATAQPGDPAAGTGADAEKPGTADESTEPASVEPSASPDAETSSDSDAGDAPEAASETNGASGDPASNETSPETEPAAGSSGSENTEKDAAADSSGSGSSDTGESGEVTDEKK